jgi:hypothetical protein
MGTSWEQTTNRLRLSIPDATIIVNVNYWTKPFWECSPEYEPTIVVELPAAPLRPGDTTDLAVVVTNPSDTERTGELSILLCESRIESKAFAERVERLATQLLTVPPGGQERLPMTLTLPATTCTDNNVFIAASFGDERAIAYLKVAPLLDVGVRVEDVVTVGDRFVLQVEARNEAEHPVDDVTLMVHTPFGMSISEDEERRGQRSVRVALGVIHAGQTVAAGFVLTSKAVLEPGVLRIEVASSRGCRRLYVPVVVQLKEQRPRTDMPRPTPGG